MSCCLRIPAATIVTLLLSGVAMPARADVVLEWNAIMQAAVGGQNPFAQGRIAAITQLAVFEAVNAVGGHYEPYLGTIATAPDASAQAAAVAAAHTVLRHYVPGSAAIFDAARMSSLSTILDGPAKDTGIAVGESAATAIIAVRATDGAAPPQFHLPPTLDPGEWQLTPGCPGAGGVLLHWQNLTPFGIERSSQFRADPPPTLKGGQYRKSYNEVMQLGDINSSLRPPDRAEVAQFYDNVLAVAAWNDVVRQIAAARHTTLSENARALALLNMAISDGLVAVMESKYHYTLWRPETAIRAGGEDGNPKTSQNLAFEPFIVAPCFPSYPSAHAAASYAAREIAERIFGGHPHQITLATAALPGVVLEYTSLDEITDDIDDARVYGGIHFRFDQRAGGRQGRAIGAFVFKHHLRPVHGAP